MLLTIKQWESKYIRDFDPVKVGEVSEEFLYSKLTAMYFDYVSSNDIEPFTVPFCLICPKRCAEVGYLPKNAPVGRLPVAHLRLFFRSHRTMYTPNRDRSFLPPLRRSGSAGQFISSDCAAALLSYRI